MRGIYVHIPFCRKKCRYCDFVSFANAADHSAYLAALISEMRTLRPMMSDRGFDTVFIGGGTPSLLNVGAMSVIMSELRKNFSIASDAEITIESNPESLCIEKLREYKKAGINRLSIGLQSSDDTVLQVIGRVHDRETFIKAFGDARLEGFDNINVDIMHGLPMQSAESYLSTIQLVSKLNAEHISSYSLILEEHTALYADVQSGEARLPDENEVADMEDAGIALLNELGYERYEISNFAKPNKKCRHNLNYWDNGEYLGLGLNAHSAMRLKGKWVRWANKASLSDYIFDCANGKIPVETTEEIQKEDEMFETVMVGLRKTDGINRKAFLERFGIDIAEHYAAAVSESVLEGNMEFDDETIHLTKRGLDFQNEILLKFM